MAQNNSCNYQTTEYNVLTGGANNLVHNVSPSTSGFVLTSNGASSQPTFQAVATSGAVTGVQGDSGIAHPVLGKVIVYANNSSNMCGSSVEFVGTSDTVTLSVTDSNQNTFIGNSSGTTGLTGTHNLGFGKSAGSALTTTNSYNIDIGAPGVSGDNNITRIGYQNSGASTQTECYLDGIVGNQPSGLTTPYLAYVDNSTGKLACLGSLITAPANSSGSSLSLGSNFQNTTGTDILLTVFISVSAATSASILSGVGSASSPTQQTIVSGLTLAALNIITVPLYIPSGYYALVSTSGTITASISGQQAMAI